MCGLWHSFTTLGISDTGDLSVHSMRRDPPAHRSARDTGQIGQLGHVEARAHSEMQGGGQRTRSSHLRGHCPAIGLSQRQRSVCPGAVDPLQVRAQVVLSSTHILAACLFSLAAQLSGQPHALFSPFVRHGPSAIPFQRGSPSHASSRSFCFSPCRGLPSRL